MKQVQIKQVGNSRGYRTFERRRAGQPGALWHSTVHHEVKALDVVAGLLQGPQDTSGVAAPAGRVTGPDVIKIKLVLPQDCSDANLRRRSARSRTAAYVRYGSAIGRHRPAL